MKYIRSRGFTLIELLVVIAIIGVLSAVVLAALNTARTKGNDAAVKSNLDGVRPQAAILFDANSCYSSTTTCDDFTEGDCANTADTLFADETIWGQITAAKAAYGAGALTSCSSKGSAVTYGVAAQLKTDPTQAWCIDSSGAAKEVDIGATPDQTSIDAVLDDTTGLCL